MVLDADNIKTYSKIWSNWRIAVWMFVVSLVGFQSQGHSTFRAFEAVLVPWLYTPRHTCHSIRMHLRTLWVFSYTNL